MICMFLVSIILSPDTVCFQGDIFSEIISIASQVSLPCSTIPLAPQ